MRFKLLAAAALTAISSESGVAQANATCTARPAVEQDACQQAVDLFNYMMPQLGTMIVGGNSTQAQGGTLGGLPHFAIGVRANVIAASVPALQAPSATLQQRANYPTDDQYLGLPAVDAAVGVFKGFPLALSNVAGIDLLLSAAYVPEYHALEVDVQPKTNIQIGYGVRVGLLEESLLVPGIAASYMIRDLPKTTISGSVGGGTNYRVDTLQVKTTAWRVTVSKSLVLFTIAAGAGQDMYDASASVSATTPLGNVAPLDVSQRVTRTTYFGELSANILLTKIVGGVGMVTGGEIPTHNTFSTAANASRLYGSLGIRLGL